MKYQKRTQTWGRSAFLSITMIGFFSFTAHAGCDTSIGDKVWKDLNGNGIQDENEPGINDVTVTLKNLDTGKIQTKKTCDGGCYEFKGNCNNHTYQITIDESTLPPEINTASPCHNESGAEPPFDKDSNCNGQKILLGHNEVNRTIDFGYYTEQETCSGGIGDYIWNDADRDGIQQVSEQGINNVEVVVTDADGNEHIAVTSTGGPLDKPGFYRVENMCKGTYNVSVNMDSIPADMDTTLIEMGTNQAQDSDDPTGTIVTLNENDQLNCNIDFGFFTTCSGQIGDYIWNDSNSNGLQDEGEQGINDIKILVTDSNNTVKSVSTFTGGPLSAPGYYLIDGLCADTYTVRIDEGTVPLALKPTIINAGDNEADDSNDPAGTTVLLENDDNKDVTIDFGYKPSCSGSIGDYIWNDTDRNGIQDLDEIGINGVKVSVRSTDNTFSVTTFTGGPQNTPGYYLVNGLCKGRYSVTVNSGTIPSGMQPTRIGAGNDPALDSNDPNQTRVLLATDDTQDTSNDFGYQTPCTGKIGDYVWNDENHDGIQQQIENGINGVEVVVTGKNGEKYTVTTFKGGPENKPGYYMINGLCPNTYRVEVNSTTVPQGMEATLIEAGNDPADDSNDPRGTNIDLTESGKNLSIDFGFLKPANPVCSLSVTKTASTNLIEIIGTDRNNGGNNSSNNSNNNGDCPVDQKVTYTYTVTNAGDKLVLTSVYDDKIGNLLGYVPKPSLGTGESTTFTVDRCLSTTTTNTVVVSGNMDGASCSAQASATVQVKIKPAPTPNPPHCSCWTYRNYGYCNHVSSSYWPAPRCNCWTYHYYGHCNHVSIPYRQPTTYHCNCRTYRHYGRCNHVNNRCRY